MKKTMPPTSGIQARAAAMFDGSPVDVERGDSGPDGGGGGGGGGLSSAGSGIGYIHRMEWCFVNSERAVAAAHRQNVLPFAVRPESISYGKNAQTF